MRVVLRVAEQEAFADPALHAEAVGLESRDRAFTRQLAFGTVQRRRTLDHVIGRLTARRRLDAPTRAALQLGLFQLLFLEGVPARAAVAESVELVKGGRSAGLVNAVLRRAAAEGRARLVDAIEDEGVRESYPHWLVELWRGAYGARTATQLMRRLNEPAEAVVRANRLKTSPEALAPELGDLQERLYAAGRSGEAGTRRILVVLQGMDTSGKGGVVRHVIGRLDPQGVSIVPFARPTEEERRRGFLWRVRRRLPDAGMVGVFDRSHYEDVVAARVRSDVSPPVVERRFDEINDFEAEAVESGIVVVKCFLHISADEQLDRLLTRLDKPDKHWKYDPGDVDDRARWPHYQEAYEAVLERCSTPAAPWYVVPADRKWYRNWAVARLLLEHLEALDLDWPVAEFDVEHERRRLHDLGPVTGPDEPAQPGIGTSPTAPTA